VETKTIPYRAFGLTVLTVATSLYPAPEGMYGQIPFVFPDFMAVVLTVVCFPLPRTGPRAGSALNSALLQIFGIFALLFFWLFLQNGRPASLSARRTRVRQGVL
jgi:hypothetical protein